MVGPKAAVKPDEILEKLLTFDIYQEDILKKKFDEIWQKVCDSLNNKINPINLYFYVTQDRHNVLSDYRIHKGIETYSDNEEADVIQENFEEESDADNETNIDSIQENSKKKLKNGLTFEISLSKEEWNSIKPEKKVYKNGQEGDSLQEGWCDILRKSIWACMKLPCAFNFKRHVIGNYEAYIRADGYCSYCNAVMTATCYNSPDTLDEEKTVQFSIDSFNTPGVPHMKKKSPTGNIGYDKFYISYWSPEQISLNNDIIKKLNHPFALDATGSIGIKLTRPGADNSEMYLTILSTYVNDMIVPVSQKTITHNIIKKNETQELEYDNSNKHSKSQKFAERIKTKVEENIKNVLSNDSLDFTSQHNDYFLPDFSTRLCTLCKEFPCWTNVMLEYFNNKDLVASSSRGEALFGQVKNDILENRHPLRTDKIVSKHCRIIEADTKIARAAINNLQACEMVSNRKIIENKDKHLHHAETWRDKVSIVLPEEYFIDNSEADASDYVKENTEPNSQNIKNVTNNTELFNTTDI
ncbi:hypothetical protein TSAR_016470 [Trichomalopsis sarcophagae]|uniref:Uncharacterized protein n=1 Tax=Trichomalopsis sarcophagae TaxID=543379 RepID=A0A232EQR9_9HYME|nr:hypothetical protein TSAR_016470 [Trichomalopsis sarcophagae]